jgi:hypothetical protein
MKISYTPINYNGSNTLIKQVLKKSFDRYFLDIHRMLLANPVTAEPFYNFHYSIAATLLNAASAVADTLYAAHYPKARRD